MPKGVYKHKTSWDKGMKGYTNKGSFKKGFTPWNKDKNFSEAHKKNLSIAQQKRIEEGRHHLYKGGISKDKEYQRIRINKWMKEMRHKRGKQYVQFCNNKRRLLTIDLTIQIVQRVYEDNIKRFGTLTCYLCLEPILFGKDCLEHKIPLSRGGTNLYKNLAVACQKCNSSKGRKTEEEFRKEEGLLSC